jgi:hypothetical protein
VKKNLIELWVLKALWTNWLEISGAIFSALIAGTVLRTATEVVDFSPKKDFPPRP